jgi:HD-GYP domain-containing protein (c-di-GMP phosphodiesterase class II)
MTDITIPIENIVDMLEDVLRITHNLDEDHGKRVQEISLQIGKRLNGGQRLTLDELQLLGFAARLHDLGRIGIDNRTLTKPSKLTQAERAEMEEHSAIGFMFLEHSGFPARITNSVHWHHEHWDGSGYPDGLKDLDIPLFPRIICIADQWDGVVSKRPYHPARTATQGLEEMNKMVNWFDPKLYAMFLSILHEEQN